jgi:hypothetical protein
VVATNLREGTLGEDTVGILSAHGRDRDGVGRSALT